MWPSWFILNIEKYDEFRGNKQIIYYEDLMSNPQIEIPRFVTFLELDNDLLQGLLDNLMEHKKNSVALYKKDHESITAEPVHALSP